MTSLLWPAVAIALASFAVVATLTSLLIDAATPRLARRIARYVPAARAAFLFRLRVLPAAFALVCAFGISLPIFLYFEPQDAEERFARTLLLVAAAGAAILVRGAWRAGTGWRATGALMRGWQVSGRRLHAFDAPMPAFAIDGVFPTVAGVGFSHPGLFIAVRVLRECTHDEVRAMVRHECAHKTCRDILKRFLIRACPDVLRRSSALDRAWTNAAEEAADARAAGGDPAFALDLAQALIRVARLAPRASTLEVASAFYLGGSIESRVRQLVEPAERLPDPSRPLGCVMACATAFGVAGLLTFAAPAIHQLMEAAVRFLP
jgi:hypothetical protein